MLAENMPGNKVALLLAPFTYPHRDFLAANLALLCGMVGWRCDVYYTAERPGGIFAAHGGQFVSGRHQDAMARLLATHDVTVFRASGTAVFAGLLAHSRAHIIEMQAGVVGPLAQFVQQLGCAADSALVIQTQGLPPALAGGLAPYLLPDMLVRQAIALPLELSTAEISAAVALGLSSAATVAVESADASAWCEAGFSMHAVDHLAQDDAYASFTFRCAERCAGQVSAFDFLEPILAAYRIPVGLSQRRAAVFGEESGDAWESFANYAARTGQPVVFCRWGGGLMRSVNSDKEFMPLARNNVSVHVVEPGRPVFHNLGELNPLYAPPVQSIFAGEPDDAQLLRWVNEGKILATIVTHSGETSHNDCVRPVYDLCAHRLVKVGISVFAERYEHEPDAVEPMLLPVGDGGVLELCEPVLHSAGNGICFEYLADPQHLARQMAAARNRIAELVGSSHAPRGVYCYLDSDPNDWSKPALALWDAIAEQGFEYVLSSVRAGPSRLLYRKGGFVVLAVTGDNNYPYSPFMRIHRAADLADAVKSHAPGQPGWIAAVVDLPVVSDIPALAFGDPYREDRPRFGDMIAYLSDAPATTQVVNVSPRTISRYARLLHDLGKIIPVSQAETPVGELNNKHLRTIEGASQ